MREQGEGNVLCVFGRLIIEGVAIQHNKVSITLSAAITAKQSHKKGVSFNTPTHL